VPISANDIRDASVAGRDLLGNATRTNPFRVQLLNDDNEVDEVDRSDELIAAVRRHGIDTVISIVDHAALSLLFRLNRKGLRSICVPKSVENDMPDTTLSFGFNTALTYTVDTLDRARQAARSAGKLGVVEVLGARAGWLALQAAIAVTADAVLIPEIPYDLKFVAATVQERLTAGRHHGLSSSPMARSR
jgi:ATP-dependent phosphofructokinase / diphosphate-dependent phosphofructokinase